MEGKGRRGGKRYGGQGVGKGWLLCTFKNQNYLQDAALHILQSKHNLRINVICCRMLNCSYVVASSLPVRLKQTLQRALAS